MKISKIALLLVSTTMLAACSFSFERHESHSHSEFYSHFETRDPISSSDNPSSKEAIFSSTVTTSNTATSSSVAPVSSSNATTSSIAQVTDKELTISFYNPTCGSLSTEVLDTRLATYMNEAAGTTFVNAIKNTKCQVSNNIPTDGEKVLIIGASSAQGSLEFTFAETIKSITITAQTYHKPYVQTWLDPQVTVSNVDQNSVLYINENHNVDLKPTDDQPVQKEYTEALNAKTLKLSTSTEEKSRVLIKSIKFVY